MGEEVEKTLKRRARNPITGKTEIIGNVSYKQWYKQNVNKYGENKIDTAVKMVKNKALDQKQYLEYKSYIGKDVGLLDNFKDIKYNDKETWENIKKYVDLSRRKDVPTSLSFSKYDSNMKNIDWEAIDFSPKRIDTHFEKHVKEFENITKEMYTKQARNLLNSEITEDILGFKSENGFVFRYDKVKNEFATSKPSGIIETYFKPNKKLEYWEEQAKKYGNKKDV